MYDMCRPQNIHLVSESMIPIPNQVRDQQQEHPHIPDIGYLRQGKVCEYPLKQIVEQRCQKEVQQAFSYANTDIDSRAFKLEYVFIPLDWNEVFKAYKYEKGRYGKRRKIQVVRVHHA